MTYFSAQAQAEAERYQEFHGQYIQIYVKRSSENIPQRAVCVSLIEDSVRVVRESRLETFVSRIRILSVGIEEIILHADVSMIRNAFWFEDGTPASLEVLLGLN